MRFIGSALGAEVRRDTDFSRYWYENLATQCGSIARWPRRPRSAASTPSSSCPRTRRCCTRLPTDQLDDAAVIVGSGHATSPSPTRCRRTSPPWRPPTRATGGPTRPAPPESGRRCAASRMRPCGRCIFGPHQNPCAMNVPGSALTVAVEDWQPRVAGHPVGRTRGETAAVAVVALGAYSGVATESESLARRLASGRRRASGLPRGAAGRGGDRRDDRARLDSTAT